MGEGPLILGGATDLAGESNTISFTSGERYSSSFSWIDSGSYILEANTGSSSNISTSS